MIRPFLSRCHTSGSAATVLLVILLSLSMSAHAQIAASLFIARKDSLSVSGSVMYPPGSGQYIHYILTHNSVAHTVDVQLSSLHHLHYFFNIMDTTYQAVNDTGTQYGSVFNRTVDISALNSASNYLTFYLYTQRKQGSVLPVLHTSLK